MSLEEALKYIEEFIECMHDEPIDSNAADMATEAFVIIKQALEEKQ